MQVYYALYVNRENQTVKKKPLFLITLGYFALGIINIHLALTALICMALPFILLYRSGKKQWCHGYCPRADFFSLIKAKGKGKKAPSWLISPKARNGILSYFCVNLMLITTSTWMVALGKIAPIEKIRLFIVFELPLVLPQLVELGDVPQAITHLAYRFYSVMISSTLLGLILTLFFKPKTWCAVCPVSTMSSRIQRVL
jgi:polyferredoxin